MTDMFAPKPLRLRVNGAAIAENWRTLDNLSGKSTACGAAVKADGYGLGACEVVEALQTAGCRDFFVATWQEAAEIVEVAKYANITVLNGVMPDDMPFATQL
ncbi:MAG: alanine racemase, partial [Pontixanthobacter sp.]